MNLFIIYTNEDKEEHFKTSLSIFDPESKIIYRVGNKFEIETRLFNIDIITWTSVKSLRQLILSPRKRIIKKEEPGLFADKLTPTIPGGNFPTFTHTIIRINPQT